jgi:hypothetical protein
VPAMAANGVRRVARACPSKGGLGSHEKECVAGAAATGQWVGKAGCWDAVVQGVVEGCRARLPMGREWQQSGHYTWWNSAGVVEPMMKAATASYACGVGG